VSQRQAGPDMSAAPAGPPPPTNSTSWLPRLPASIRLAHAEIGGAEVVLADQLHTRAGRARLLGRLADAAGHPAAAIAPAAGRAHGANALRRLGALGEDPAPRGTESHAPTT
jgi:hypothetical protein